MSAKIKDTKYFGKHDLPQEQQDALRKAIWLERTTLILKAFAVIVIFSLAGSSQAMKAAWIEDSLSLLPPLAFLIAIRFISRKTTPSHPYGYHRAIGVGHLVAATALLTLGGYLLVDSGMGLLMGDRPPIGMMEIFGFEVWSGWLMAGVAAVIALPSVFLGRAKLKLAPVLHNKLLFTDADMNKADWMTGLATAIGVLGVGAGLWWFDAAVAILISLDILYDGIKNLRTCLAGLIDARVTTTDSKDPHPLIADVRQELLALDWVDEADTRIRDQGQVFHTEVFVVPHKGQLPALDEIETVRERLSDMDWKLHDLVIIPVAELSEEFMPQSKTMES